MRKKSNDIVFTAALRSAIGKYDGIWKKKQAHEIGSLVIKSILSKSKVEPNFIDEVIMGQVLTGGTGQNPARQAAIFAGLEKSVQCLTINKMCGSGLQAIMIADQIINNNPNEIIIQADKLT